MNTFKAWVVVCALVGLLAGTAGAVNIETVPVGNPGNAGELSGGGIHPARVCGAVDYTYHIGKYEVSAGLYTEFLNKVAGVDSYGLYNTEMWSSSYGCQIERFAGTGTTGDPYQYRVSSAYANRPVNFVSWGSAARFTNWLHNGQPMGPQNASTTEDGSYALNGAITDAELRAATRKPNATWVIPSEDEWYKAAYHKNDGVTGNYFDYPTSSDSISTSMANYDMFVGHSTDVGSYACSSPYGTFDQGGNMWEWTETVLDVRPDGTYRVLHGGTFDGQYYYLDAMTRWGGNQSGENNGRAIGFRVASSARIRNITQETYHVTIQAAIDAAINGDVIEILAGRYNEVINFSGKAITLRSTDGPDVTTIDGTGLNDSVVKCVSGEGPDTVLEGFTLTGGNATEGGGIWCNLSSPTITKNTITGNSASGYGGGIGSSGGSAPMISNNTIINNAAVGGGGITCSGATMVINNRIMRNTASSSGGGIWCSTGSATIANNIVAGNAAYINGGGIYCHYSTPTIVSNTIAANAAGSSVGGGICCNDANPLITNNVISFNASGVTRATEMGHNCVYGNVYGDYYDMTDPTGIDGNISVDPLFVRSPDAGPDGNWGTPDDDLGDLHLSPGSPCIDAGGNLAFLSAALTAGGLGGDLDGNGRMADDANAEDTGAGIGAIIDMGVYEFPGGPPGADLDLDGDVDLADFSVFAACFNGPNRAPACP